MLKICHFTTLHSIDDGRIFLKECTSLANYDFDVTLIACGNGHSYTDKKNNVTRHYLSVPVNNRLQRFIKRSKHVYKKAIEVDANIYHFHDPELLPVGLKLKKKGKKVIYDAHEDLPAQILYKDWIPSPLKKIASCFFKHYENFFSKKLDGIVTVNETIAMRFSKINNNVIICRNYASISEFEEIIDTNNARNNVCYIGYLTELRGIYQISNASQKANVTLELAGFFEKDNLKNKVLSENVIYHGIVNREQVKEIFSRSFAGLVTFLPSPNHDSSSPNKLFEYMAAGIPIIASNFNSWKTIIDDNNIGFTVDPYNIDEIANVILFLKNNPEIAREMGRKGRKAFENKYNWQIEEKKLIQLYTQIK